MAFTMANMKKSSPIFRMNQTMPGIQVKGANAKGGSHPPMNRITVRAQTSTTATYSAIRNMRNGVAEYSTKYPATSSDSASGRSKGGRLVSAKPEMKKMMKSGNIGSQCQSRNVLGRPIIVPSPVVWASTMSERFNDPTANSTAMMTKPMETS